MLRIKDMKSCPKYILCFCALCLEMKTVVTKYHQGHCWYDVVIRNQKYRLEQLGL